MYIGFISAGVKLPSNKLDNSDNQRLEAYLFLPVERMPTVLTMLDSGRTVISIAQFTNEVDGCSIGIASKK